MPQTLFFQHLLLVSSLSLMNIHFFKNVLFFNSPLKFGSQDSFDYDNPDEAIRSNQSNTFKYNYFYNMTANFGNNEAGSCGYVAMAMLLTYFDTCCDDNIVPESYEVKGNLLSLNLASCTSSPGSQRESQCPSQYLPYDETIFGFTRTNYHLYKVWLNNNYYSTSLHAKLIIDATGMSAYNGPGVGPSTFVTVFSQYFSAINYTDYQYIRSPVGSTSSEVKQWVIDQITNYNRPVILGRAGHVTVAYDYDDVSDKVYVHNGYVNQTHLEFTYNFDDAHTLVFTGNHNHSDNYTFASSDSCCGCGYTTHVHDGAYGYTQYDSAQHLNSCSCGMDVLETHTMVIIQRKPVLIMGCTQCGYLEMRNQLNESEDENF